MKSLSFLRYFLYNCPSEVAEIFCVVVTLPYYCFLDVYFAETRRRMFPTWVKTSE